MRWRCLLLFFIIPYTNEGSFWELRPWLLSPMGPSCFRPRCAGLLWAHEAGLGLWLPVLGLLLTYCTNMGWSQISQVKRKSQHLHFRCFSRLFPHPNALWFSSTILCYRNVFILLGFIYSHCRAAVIITMPHLVSKQGILVQESAVRTRARGCSVAVGRKASPGGLR